MMIQVNLWILILINVLFIFLLLVLDIVFVIMRINGYIKQRMEEDEKFLYSQYKDYESIEK